MNNETGTGNREAGTMVQRYLDGEVPVESLTAEERAEAAEFETLLKDAAAMRSVTAPPWLETRVMATIPARPQASRAARLFGWLLSPQAVRVRPVSLALAGLAAAVLIFFARSQPGSIPVATNSPANVHAVSNVEPAVIYVQFVLADKNAKSVTVAGDFNAWDVSATPLTDANGNGIWTGRVALRPGAHKYMFVVDGKRWVTDPEAESYIDDGFGMRNAIVTVTTPNARSI